MRAAPPVDYPLARRGLWDRAGCVLAAVAMLTPMAWATWHLRTIRAIAGAGTSMLLLSGVLLAVLAAAACWRAAGRRPTTRLRWDGTHWQRTAAAGHPEDLEPPRMQIDLGAALLLRTLRTTGRFPVWLALERRDAPAAWHALRVALAQPPAAVLEGPGQPIVGADT